jgi:hypothetical protein
MKETLRRHLAVPALLAAAAIIAFTAWRIGAARDAWTFALRDVAGDRAALQGVMITGELADGYHRTAFAIADGRVAHRTVVKDPPAPPAIEEPFHPGARRSFDGILYEARPSSIGRMDVFDVRFEDRRDPGRYRGGTARVKTGLTHRRTESGQYRFTNDLNYGIAKIGERVFFTVTTSREFSGMNGIYAIDEFPERLEPFEPASHGRLLAAIDLERNRELPESSLGLEVLGLEAAGDRLALIAVDEGKLAVYAYDPTDGTRIGERVLDAIAVCTDPCAAPAGDVHYASYEAYPDHDTGVLNLLLYRVPDGPDRVSVTMLSLDLTDAVRRLATVRESYERDRMDRDAYPVTKLSYRGGKLIAVKSLQETEEESGLYGSALQPRRLMIYVYEDGRPVYQGELRTDADDDLYRPADAAGKGFSGYTAWNYRRFTGIEIADSASGG